MAKDRHEAVFRITLQGVVYCFVMGMLFAAAVVREINLLLLIAAAMIGPLLYNVWHCLAAFRGLELRRDVPARVTAGSVVEVAITLSQRRRGSALAIRVSDGLTRDGRHLMEKQLKPSVWFARVPSASARTAAYRCRLGRRGRYRLGPLVLSTQFPFGLWRRQRVLRHEAVLTVWPRLGRLRREWSRSQQAAYQASQATTRRQGLFAGDFHSLRNWRQGDSRRWIHWRTSARQGELMVRQFEQQRNQDLALVLELWQPAEPAEQHLERVELAVRFAATVLADRCRRGGCRVQLAVAARKDVVAGGAASMAVQNEFMDALAVAEATPGDRLPQLLARVLPALRRETGLLIVSTRDVTLSDTERFREIWGSRRLRMWASRAHCINAGQPEFLQMFDPSE